MDELVTQRVIVIGSGFGGAVAASHLAEAGIKVVLLERGPWRDTVPVRSMGIKKRSPFPQGNRGVFGLLRTLRNKFLPGGGITLNPRALFEMHTGKGLNVLCSSSVGGGSHVYTGVTMKPPDEHYWDDVADGLTASAMDVNYEKVLTRLGSRKVRENDEIPNTLAERFCDNQAFDTENVDSEMPMGFLFPETPEEPQKRINEDGVERYETTPGEDGSLGSIKGGKTTLDFAYLARALKHGLIVKDLHEVTRISNKENNQSARYRVETINHHDGSRVWFYADNVIIAAGALNTLRILFSSCLSNGLSTMQRLGQQFGGNGDFFGYWNLNDKQRNLTVGMPTRGPIRLKENVLSNENTEWPMIAEAATLDPAIVPFSYPIARKLRQGSFVAGMGRDNQDGVVSFKSKRLKINYDPAKSSIFTEIINAFRLMSEKTGCRIYFFKRPTTTHPTGGACIGKNRDNGMVDGYGQSFDNPGLYVADASALPKPVCAPASLTIAAWSLHVADNLLKKISQ